MSNTNNTLLYPIQYTEQGWNIPIKCYHDDQISDTHVNLSEFRYDDPQGVLGSLCYYDKMVIPIQTFRINLISLYHNYITIDVNIRVNDYITLRDLILFIKNTYIHIYDEEEQTSTLQTFFIEKQCETCVDYNFENYVYFIEKSVFNNDDDDEDQCSICFEEFNKDDVYMFKCGHMFHKKCVTEWFNTKYSCPLCRRNIIECDDCNGEGVVTISHHGAVIPREYRGENTYRNTTDGRYNIQRYDFEDLYISKLHFDIRSSTLDVYIVGI